MKILSFGEVLWDVYPDKKFIGGAPLNFAAHLAKHGEKVAMLTTVGNDEMGLTAKEIIRNFGIDDSYVLVSDEIETGKCLVTLNENQVPSYNLLQNAAYDRIDTDIGREKFDILYFGTLALRNDYNRKSLSELIGNNDFQEIFVDVNIRSPFFDDEIIAFAAKNATILKISKEELPVILKSLKFNEAKSIEENIVNISLKFSNLRLVILTCGSEGAIVYDCNNKKVYNQCAGKEKPVSTVGAGDSFSAGFIHKFIGGCDISACLAYATKLADFVVSRYDAVPDYKISQIG